MTMIRDSKETRRKSNANPHQQGNRDTKITQQQRQYLTKDYLPNWNNKHENAYKTTLWLENKAYKWQHLKKEHMVKWCLLSKHMQNWFHKQSHKKL